MHLRKTSVRSRVLYLLSYRGKRASRVGVEPDVSGLRGQRPRPLDERDKKYHHRMEHTHHWRATSKVFARVCDCGVAYHDWLLTENEWLLTEVDRLTAAPLALSSVEESTLRAQLEEARREAAILRAELDEARRELVEARANKVSPQIDAACTGSLVHGEFTPCPVHR